MALLSARNPRVARLRRLSRQPGARRSEGLFVIDGPTLVRDALAAGVEAVEAFVEPDTVPGELLDTLDGSGVEVCEVGGETLRGATDPSSPRGIALVARAASLPGTSAAAAVAGDDPLVVVLDGVADPGNVGTVLRSAEAAGATAVVVGDGAADPESPRAVRASAGARFRVPVARLPLTATVEGWAGLVDRLGATRFDPEGSLAGSYDGADLARPVAVLLGNEAHGISAEVAAHVDRWIGIPMAAGESLNVAMAATVLLFEAARQRRACATGDNRFAEVAPARQGSRR